MVARFRSLDTWAHLAQLDALEWDFPLFSTNNRAGSLTVTGEHPELAMTWVAVGDRFFYVDGATPNEKTTKLSIRHPSNAFSRSIAFSPLTGSLESYIAGVLTSAFKTQTDLLYKMPYLSITSSGNTNAALAYKDGEVIDFFNVIQYAQERGIDLTFTPGSSTLGVSVSQRTTSTHNLVLGDGHSQLKSYTRTYSTIAKVTVRRVTVNDDSITVNSTEDWYALSDGSVSTTAPSPRLRGKWAIVSVEDNDISSQDAALEAVAKNKSSYKLIFYSDVAFHLGDHITARFDGMVQSGEITACNVSSKDPRFLYEMGTMPTTLTDKLTATESPVVEQPIAIEEAEPEYLSRTGGSVGGDLHVTEDLTAGKLILTSDGYGTSLPSSGVEGQVFFLLT